MMSRLSIDLLHAESHPENYGALHSDYPQQLLTRRTLALQANQLMSRRCQAPTAMPLRLAAFRRRPPT